MIESSREPSIDSASKTKMFSKIQNFVEVLILKSKGLLPYSVAQLVEFKIFRPFVFEVLTRWLKQDLDKTSLFTIRGRMTLTSFEFVKKSIYKNKNSD
jgi:hypothetical protein